MNCPRCDQVMKDGSIEVHGDFRTLMAYGLSYQRLWWHETHKKPVILLEPRMTVDAFRCDNCQTLVVPSPPSPPPPAIFRRVTNELAKTVFRPLRRR